MKEIPLIRSYKAALVCLGILVLPTLAMCFTPITALYAALILLFVYPLGSCMTNALGGLLPGTLVVCAGVVCGRLIAGPQGALIAACYLVPIFLGSLLIVKKKPPFFLGCAIMIVVHILSFSAVYLYLQRLFDHQLYAFAADAAIQYFNQSPYADPLLAQFYSMGILSLPTEMKDQFVLLPSGAFLMTPAAREDLLLSLRSLTEAALFNLVMVLFTSLPFISGVACLLLPQRFGQLAHERQVFMAQEGEKVPPFPNLNMPPLSLWHLPRGVGWKVGAAWLAGSLLQTMGSANATAVAGVILYQGATALFTWQGAALLNFTQKIKGTRRPARVLIPLLFFVLGILPYLGIFDQIINLRGLRKPPTPKEEQ